MKSCEFETLNGLTFSNSAVSHDSSISANFMSSPTNLNQMNRADLGILHILKFSTFSTLWVLSKLFNFFLFLIGFHLVHLTLPLIALQIPARTYDLEIAHNPKLT